MNISAGYYFESEVSDQRTFCYFVRKENEPCLRVFSKRIPPKVINMLLRHREKLV